MKILVCVKQVPDTEGAVIINNSKNWIDINDKSSFRLNRFDEYAVEEAVRIKEALPGTAIDAISAGPARSEAALRRAMGIGADNGIHIIMDDNYHFPFEIASLISAYAKDKKYDIIFTGAMSEDGMHCQTGPMIAAMLDIPFAASCISEKLVDNGSAVHVEREIEGGLRDSLDLSLPALLAVQSGINHPRYPSLSNVLRAKKQEITRIDA
ncbi:MAG: electron transfer flavoprotein subunit beta/FixA family protein, partial [Spirochaetes bacterium]|nr:electron transfer flavoprotein subunit beta/FixA family protein [Spirochaetota bacterium]